MPCKTRKGAPRASEPCRTPSMPSDLAMLEAEFWRIWAMFPTAKAEDLKDLHSRLNTIVGCVWKVPITSMADAAVKARVARQRASLIPEYFHDREADDPKRVAAEILQQVIEHLEGQA